MTRWTKAQFLKCWAVELERRQAEDPPVAAPDKYRSSWERRFAELLEFRRTAGEIKSWQYEPITLKLPGGVRYTPDFLITDLDDWLSIVEVKGVLKDSARIKLRQAVELYPSFRWYVVRDDMIPIRLLRATDVPAATRSRKKDLEPETLQ